MEAHCLIWAATASPSPGGSSGGLKCLVPPAISAPTVHADKTQADDEAVTIVDFAGDAFCIIENSWARRGGMDDRIEVYGEGGFHHRQSADGQCAANLQRVWLRLCGRKSADHHRVELSGLRRAVELWLPAGDAPLREGDSAAWNRRRSLAKTEKICARGYLCFLRFGGPGPESILSLPANGIGCPCLSG